MDDLKTLIQQIDSAINPSALPGGILAANHNAVLQAILSTVGRYTGFAFVAKDTGQAPQGSLLWNGNAMNNTSPFTLTISQKTTDGNDLGALLGNATSGDIIRFKDFEGRSALLTFASYVSSDDGSGNNTYNITVQGVVDNPSFTYTTEELACIITLELSGGSGGVNFFTVPKPSVWKKPGNANTSTVEVGDFCKTYISATKIIEGPYTGLGIDPADLSDEANFNVFNEIDLT